MTIRAKYQGACSSCGRKITPGQEIEWKKGTQPRHSRCAQGSPARRSSYPSTPPEPGAHEIAARSAGRDDRYHIGQVLHAPKVAGAGGGPDGHYYTVIAETWCPAHDDNQQFEPARQAWVRPATDAEAAPLAERAARKALDGALRSELVALVQAGVHAPEAEARLPEGPEVVIRAGVQGSGREVCRLTQDGAVALWYSGHYDDYRRSLWTTTDPRAVELMGKLLEGGVR